MTLNTAALVRFKGGQLEIQNPRVGYTYRGEIQTAVVEDNAVKVQFAWLARGKGGFPPTGWYKANVLSYEASVRVYAAIDIGDGRIALRSPAGGEEAVFFPPDSSNMLDPAMVEGLDLAT
jgi:hypothetical protein